MHTRTPNVFICGFTKCATSSLHDWLVQHPKISGGIQKELEYLYDADSFFFNKKHSFHVNGAAGYINLFPSAPQGSLLIDSTPAYVYHKAAREFVSKSTEKPLVIFVSRNPVDQIVSTYHYFYNNKAYINKEIGIESFLEMVIDGEAQRYFMQDHLKNALDWACFDYWMALWARDIGSENILHLEMKTLLSDPKSVVNQIFHRLGLETAVPVKYSASNETYFVRSRALHQMNLRVRKFLPKGKLYYATREIYHRINADKRKPEISEREANLRLILGKRIEDRCKELLKSL